MKELTHIVKHYLYVADIPGRYNIKMTHDKVVWKGVEYKYWNSGLTRTVFISPDKKYVLKIPNSECYDDWQSDQKELEEYKKYNKVYFLGTSVIHNILEAQCYDECPKEYKKYFAHSKLLSNGWVKQEFVDVKNELNSKFDIREIGVVGKRKRLVIFDYDIMFDRFERPYHGFYYEKVPKLIHELSINHPNFLI